MPASTRLKAPDAIRISSESGRDTPSVYLPPLCSTDHQWPQPLREMQAARTALCRADRMQNRHSAESMEFPTCHIPGSTVEYGDARLRCRRYDPQSPRTIADSRADPLQFASTTRDVPTY